MYNTNPESIITAPYSHIMSDTPTLWVVYNMTELLLKNPGFIIRLKMRQATETAPRPACFPVGITSTANETPSPE